MEPDTTHPADRPAQSPRDVDLRSRFASCWPAKLADEAFAELIVRYSEPARCYHDLDHLRECLAWVDTVRASQPELAGFEEAELALFFHDAVLVPTRRDNERKSAELYESWARRAGVCPSQSKTVCNAILATSHHRAATTIEKLVCDADLAILGSEANRYGQYASSVRREFAHVPPAAYRLGRAAFLRGLLARPALFHLPFFRQALEARARKNLARELGELETSDHSEPAEVAVAEGSSKSVDGGQLE